MFFLKEWKRFTPENFKKKNMALLSITSLTAETDDTVIAIRELKESMKQSIKNDENQNMKKKFHIVRWDRRKKLN